MSVDRQFNESDNEVNSPQYSIADQCLSVLSREQIGKSAIETGIESGTVIPDTEIASIGTVVCNVEIQTVFDVVCNYHDKPSS